MPDRERWERAVTNAVNDLQTAAARAQAERDAAKKKELLETQIKIASAIYDKAVAYTNLIMLAGFAGFFGLWSLTRAYLDKSDVLWSALLMIISVCSFACWEVYKMVVTGLQAQRRAFALRRNGQEETVEDFVQRLQAMEAENMKDAVFLSRVWPVIVCIAVPCGVAAYVVLLQALIRGLVAP